MRRKLTAIILALVVCTTSTPVSYAANEIDFSQETIENAFNKVVDAAKDLDAYVFSKLSDIFNHWAKPYIDALVSRGVTSGYPDGTFKPDNQISIAEFTTLLVKQNQYDLVSVDGDWFKTYIKTASENGVIKTGEFDSNVDYTDNITRAEMARMIAHAADLDEVKGNIFADDSKMSSDTKGYIYAVAKAGIISGFEDGAFRGNDGATRAQACVMLENLNKFRAGELSAVEVYRLADLPDYPKFRQPSDLNSNDEIWTDDEFVDLIMNNMSEMYYTIPYSGQWKLDPETRHFSVKTDADENGNIIYTDIDEMMDGEVFRMAKAVVYHAKQNGLEVTMYDFADGAGMFSVKDPERGFQNVQLSFIYDSRGQDVYYKRVPGYEVGKTEMMHEWYLFRMFDSSAVYKDEGYVLASMSSEEQLSIAKKYNYTEQKYTDFVYGVCKELYGSEGMQMYEIIMGEHLAGQIDKYENGNKEGESKMIETADYTLYYYCPSYGKASLGIADK